MLLFDIIVGSILGLSLLVGLLRGITKELLNIFSWFAAAGMTYFLLPYALILAKTHINNQQIAEYAAYAGLFISLLILFSLISYLLSSMIKNSALGGIDRSFGFGFGMIRAIIILGCMDLVMGVFFARSNPPAFLKETKTLNHVHALGDELMSRLPKKWHDLIKSYHKNNLSEEEKVIQLPQDLSKLQEMNVAALANLAPQVADMNTEDNPTDTPENSKKIDQLLDDESEIPIDADTEND